jgi:hypothetical protein
LATGRRFHFLRPFAYPPHWPPPWLNWPVRFDTSPTIPSALEPGTAAPGTRPPDRPRRRGQWLPAGDGPGALPGLHVVRDGGEQPAQFDCGRELATTIEGGTDCGGFCLGDNEHPPSMGTRTTTGKRPSRAATSQVTPDIRSAGSVPRRASVVGSAPCFGVAPSEANEASQVGQASADAGLAGG